MTTDGDITDTLRRFVACELLGDPDSAAELSDDAPLLEWGVLDSLNTARLLAYLTERFGVEVPVEQVVVEHFRDLGAIARLVRELQGGGVRA